MATAIVLVGCYYGYNASGGTGGRGHGDGQVDGPKPRARHVIGMLGTQIFWGGNPRAPIGG